MERFRSVAMTTYVLGCLVAFIAGALLWHRCFPRKCRQCGGRGVLEEDETSGNRIFRCSSCGWMKDLGRDVTGGWD